MTLKDDLLRKGYLPENLPPAFTTKLIADHFLEQPSSNFHTRLGTPLRAATYNASKRGLTRRVFSAVHPATAHNMAKFVSDRWDEITVFLSQSNTSFSIPEHTEDTDRALVIKSHMALEKEKYKRLSACRFIAGTDIARFYHSIYTHSIPWAFHGKANAKADRRLRSQQVFFNRADAVIRNGQDGQTVGIPVGPDMSRVFAEVIGVAIDKEFEQRREGIDCEVIRHVDDVWIGANSHADAEQALSLYREAIREFELDINESKTGIFATEFSFSDYWPTEISNQIEFAINSPKPRANDRLRSTLEHVFAMAVSRNDEGILKYVLRYVDQHNRKWNWDVVEPFLKRMAVHFGHTIDYIARILIWRQLTRGDLDLNGWSRIMGEVLGKHGRLGNDSEVCWTIYAHHHLDVKVSHEAAKHIVRNCGALSIVALLNTIDRAGNNLDIFKDAFERLKAENDSGRYWPVFLEWKTKHWPRHVDIVLSNPTIKALHESGAHVYDLETLPAVFQNVEKVEFEKVASAIEILSEIYGHGEENDDEFLIDGMDSAI